MLEPALTWTDSRAADPEPPPDDDGEGPWCFYRDLWGQHIHPDHLTTMTTIQPAQEFL